MVCETRENDPVLPSEITDGSGVCLEDNNEPLEINTEVKVILEITEEEHRTEQDTAAEQDWGMMTSHDTHSEEHKNGKDCQTTLVVEGDNGPTHDSPGQEEINEQEKEEIKSDAPDILQHEQGKPSSETTEMLYETEEENTSIETDNDNGQGSCDEQENETGPSLSVSPTGSHLEFNSEQLVPGSRPDISRHSYSRYDTVSYRKIRKGNTKQRIDEFESMMN
uniref:Ermin n=2 Tax=Pyxicephalus adspersus TaxID=30357 RepID=A0AAV3A078_PYXAD|nr:TPA: hypothetical protein GDO54_015535 [Pyxicephalus adspersus]